jgi:hypothetical protein
MEWPFFLDLTARAGTPAPGVPACRPARGDATLVERETGAARVTVWDLCAGDGRYFFSRTEAGLPAQVKENNSQGGGWAGREIAAAIYAVKGDLGTAALKMAWPTATPVPTFSSALIKDGAVWEDSGDALVAGSGNPQVRAGVPRLMSWLPGITVAHGTVDGQPALTRTAGAAESGHSTTGRAAKFDPDSGPANQEAIAINADTGIPLQIATGTVGHVSVGVAYVVSRVNLADIAAGKFPPALSSGDPRPARTRGIRGRCCALADLVMRSLMIDGRTANDIPSPA